MIGFPEDTVDSIRHVLAYAKAVNPTYANFNIVTPYPGTEFFQHVKDEIADFDFTKYNVYTPVMKYKNLTPEQVQFWHAKCFMRYFFRWEWLTSNAHMLWPKLQYLGVGRKYAARSKNWRRPRRHPRRPRRWRRKSRCRFWTTRANCAPIRPIATRRATSPPAPRRRRKPNSCSP